MGRCDFAFLLVCLLSFYSPDFILPGDTVVCFRLLPLAQSATNTTAWDTCAPITISVTTSARDPKPEDCHNDRGGEDASIRAFTYRLLRYSCCGSRYVIFCNGDWKTWPNEPCMYTIIQNDLFVHLPPTNSLSFLLFSFEDHLFTDFRFLPKSVFHIFLLIFPCLSTWLTTRLMEEQKE